MIMSACVLLPYIILECMVVECSSHAYHTYLASTITVAYVSSVEGFIMLAEIQKSARLTYLLYTHTLQ